MKIEPKLEQKQKQKQVEIHEMLRTRCFEVVNNGGQIIARIGEETPDPDKDVNEKKNIATFFDDEENEIACLKNDKFGTELTLFGSDGNVSIRSGHNGGGLSVSRVNHDGNLVTLSIRSFFSDGFSISVKNTEGKHIDLDIDVDEGKVKIESVSEIESEDKEIRTSQTIFKSAE